MSLLAKVFVILNLVLAVCFFATSATLFKTRNDWKLAYLSYKDLTAQKVEELDEKIGRMTGQIDELDKRNVTYKGDNDRLASDNKSLREQIAAKDAEIVQVEEDRKEQTILAQNLAKSLEGQEQTNQQLQTTLETAKNDLDAALSRLQTANETRDRALLDLSKNNEDLHSTRVELANLSEEAETLRAQVEYIRLKDSTLLVEQLAPPIDALVSAVDNEQQLVVLSVGDDQKVQRGYEFTVARGNQFIGKVQVIRVYADLSGARVVYTKEGEQIRRGDQVFTARAAQ